MRCFAVVLVLGGFGGVKLANATDSSDIQIEKAAFNKTTIEKTERDRRTASPSKITTEKTPVDLTIRDAAWLKPASESRRPAKSSLVASPRSNATSKAVFLRQQPQGSAQQLLAEAPIVESSIAQATSPQDTDALRRQLVIDPLVELRIPAYSPGSSVGVPTAFGANFGDAFVGLSFSNRRPRINEADGALSVGFGLGDSETALGLEVSANIGSLRRFGRNGDIGFKLHRSLPGKAAIALGFDSGIVWGEENETTVSTLYGAASKVFDLRPGNLEDSLPLTLTLGIGGGRFRSFENIQNGQGGVGVFASAGLRVVPQASVIGSWTGQDLNLGVSYVPLKTTPLFLTFVVGNVLSRNDNATLFSFGIGYGFNYTGYQY
ncbi:hypothetical protein [Leptolyngbya sp. NIES-2104]|uniref:hypothetical protein n=1 Tax=Leptolyngbya sp. NIES-2104 TaxID=1552121 RepID=UPI0006ECB753|nr:hypothetical protein [Leptolyngbya sp. NIES-2104]GAP93793.1 hypothetical protein NIES2104_03010 [Leptolyngbya sp. NIES-2104]